MNTCGMEQNSLVTSIVCFLPLPRSTPKDELTLAFKCSCFVCARGPTLSGSQLEATTLNFEGGRPSERPCMPEVWEAFPEAERQR